MYRGQVAEISNREDLELLYQLIDDDTAEPIDLTEATIVARISDQSNCTIIDASLTDGKITLVEDTTMRIFIPVDEVGSLCPGTYIVGVTVENADTTKQLIAGTLAVVNGIVS